MREYSFTFTLQYHRDLLLQTLPGIYFHMEYNTTRSKMLMPEYGRNVQKMAQHLLTIEDRERRLKAAEVVVELMGTLNPHLKTIEDYRHKLWDHLYQMTDLQLDVDAPYPPPTLEQLHRKPDPLPYPQVPLAHRHLGRNLEALLQKALEETDPEKKQGFTQTIGYYMKLAYTNWHREPIHDDMIKNELYVLSDGQLQYEPGGYKVHFDSRAAYKQRNPQPARSYKNGSGRSQNGGGSQQRNSYGNNFNKNRKFNKNKSK